VLSNIVSKNISQIVRNIEPKETGSTIELKMLHCYFVFLTFSFLRARGQTHSRSG